MLPVQVDRAWANLEKNKVPKIHMWQSNTDVFKMTLMTQSSVSIYKDSSRAYSLWITFYLSLPESSHVYVSISRVNFFHNRYQRLYSRIKHKGQSSSFCFGSCIKNKRHKFSSHRFFSATITCLHCNRVDDRAACPSNSRYAQRNFQLSLRKWGDCVFCLSVVLTGEATKFKSINSVFASQNIAYVWCPLHRCPYVSVQLLTNLRWCCWS